MVRIMCRRCLRRWYPRRVAERSTCPHCGGALDDRESCGAGAPPEGRRADALALPPRGSSRYGKAHVAV
jgi:hypothetical protein